MKLVKCLLVFVYVTLFSVSGFSQWNVVNSNEGGVGSYFSNANTGYVVGGTTMENSGYVLKTTDGGSTWNKITTNSYGFNAIHFPTADVGYAVGWRGIISKTTDAGATWTQQRWGTSTEILKSVFFTDANIGYAVGIIGPKILKTTDGGANWTEQAITGATSTYSVYFIDANIGYIAAGAGRILKTTDGGTNWSSNWDGINTGDLYSIFFTDTNTGYAVGVDGKIIKTKDGATTWTLQTSVDNTTELYSVWFTDANTGYIVGDWGLIMKTTDGGTTWTQQTSGTLIGLNSIFFPNPNTGYAVGGSIILKTGSGTWVDRSESTLPNEFQLLQNYPNPFNQSTTIAFSVPTRSFVSLKVYDPMGRVVSSLVAKELSAGIYAWQWNAAGFSSGVYFYQLQSGSVALTKKLVLLK